MIREDCYKTLGLKNNANECEIKKAFHRLALQYHPDKQIDRSENNLSNKNAEFQKITAAYKTLMNEDYTISENFGSVSSDPMGEYFDAFQAENIDKLNELNSEYPINFNVDILLNKYSIKTKKWIIDNNRVNVNEPIDLELTFRQTDRYDYYINRHIYYTNFRYYYKNYKWQSTIFGYAIIEKNYELISLLINNKLTNFNILLPHSAVSKEYVTILEYSAKNQILGLLNFLLDENYCDIPPIHVLQNSIYLADHAKSYDALKILKDYRDCHYRYNIFKLNYNKKWHKKIDISERTNFEILQEDFMQAANDFVDFIREMFFFIFSWEGVKSICNSVFSWELVYVLLFMSTFCLIMGSFLYVTPILSSLAAGTFSDILTKVVLIFYGSIYCAMFLGVEPMQISFLNYMDIHGDMILDSIKGFVYSLWQNVANTMSGIFYKNVSQPNPESFEKRVKVFIYNIIVQLFDKISNFMYNISQKVSKILSSIFYFKSSQSNTESSENIESTSKLNEFFGGNNDFPNHKTAKPILFFEQNECAQKKQEEPSTTKLDPNKPSQYQNQLKRKDEPLFAGMKKGFLC